jgi:hypothetical protein
MYSIIYGTTEEEHAGLDELCMMYPDVHVMHGFFHSWFFSKSPRKLVEFMTDNFVIDENEVLDNLNHNVTFTKEIVFD